MILLCTCSKITMIIVNFNYDILKHQHNSLITEFLNVMYTNFLQSSILEPARIAAYNRPSTAGNILINSFAKKVSRDNLVDKISNDMPNC